jgi:hypothetical protein
MIPDPITAKEKQQALERVVGSRTSGRSDQLRGFLRYVCEAELEGRARQLNEYAPTSKQGRRNRVPVGQLGRSVVPWMSSSVFVPRARSTARSLAAQ